MDITMNTMVNMKNNMVEKVKADFRDFDDYLTTAKDVVVESVIDGSKALGSDLAKVGLIVGVGVFGYCNGYGEVIMKQIEEAKRLGRYMYNLAGDLYLDD